MIKKYPLKREPEFGVFLWWPGDDDSWIHPHDVPKAEDLIPGNRVLRREDYDDDYSLLIYGDYQIRVQPAMWLPVASEGYNIGDQVEVRSNFGENQPFIGTIAEMIWSRTKKQIEYEIHKPGSLQAKIYTASQFHLVDRLNRVPVRPGLEIRPR